MAMIHPDKSTPQTQELLTTCLVERGSAKYGETTRFVADQYREHFGAELGEFMPGYIVLEQDDAIVAAAGFRPAGHEQLFLEQYLADPVEVALAGHFPELAARSTIVEIGQLAVSRPELLRLFFREIAFSLDRWGFEYLVCTGTRCLAQCLIRAGIKPRSITTARADRVKSAATNWGTYYEHQPRVLAGEIRLGAAQLSAHQKDQAESRKFASTAGL